MNLNNEFDELARRKLQEQAFPFEEANWSEMQKSLNGGRKRRAGGFWILGSAAVLLVGISSWWLLQDRSSTGPVTEVREEHSGNAPEHTASEAPAHTVIARTGSVSSSEKAIATGTVIEAPVTGQAANVTTARASNTKSTGSDVRSTSSNTSIEAGTSTAKGGDRPSAPIAGTAGGSSIEGPEDRSSMGSTGTSSAVVGENGTKQGEDRTNDGTKSIAGAVATSGVAAGTLPAEGIAKSGNTVPAMDGQQVNAEESGNNAVGAEEQATAVNPADSVAEHVQDTLIAGGGLCEKESVQYILENASAAIDWLVKQGIPFRHAHELVGKAVAESVSTGTPLDKLDLSKIDSAYTPDAQSVFDLQTALAARTNPGAPSVENVKREIARWKSTI